MYAMGSQASRDVRDQLLASLATLTQHPISALKYHFVGFQPGAYPFCQATRPEVAFVLFGNQEKLFSLGALSVSQIYPLWPSLNNQTPATDVAHWAQSNLTNCSGTYSEDEVGATP